MSTTLRAEGIFLDLPYVVETGTDITAGTMVWADVSGTNVIHPLTAVRITALAESSGFVGILAETLSGSHTGVTIGTQGVWLLETAIETGMIMIGQPVWAVGPRTACAKQPDNTAGASGAGQYLNLTASNPIGICVGFPGAVDTTAASVSCEVKIFPFRKLRKLWTAAGTECGF